MKTFEREIKFRGKCLRKGEWWEGYYIYSGYDDKHYISSNAIIHGNLNQFVGLAHFAEVDPETVGQLTGLKDKNGKEIYEGDCLKITSEYLVKCGYYNRNIDRAKQYRKNNYAFYEVFFHDNDSCDNHIGFQMNRRHTVGADGEAQGLVNFRPEITKNCEIIGNIHEPEKS